MPEIAMEKKIKKPVKEASFAEAAEAVFRAVDAMDSETVDTLNAVFDMTLWNVPAPPYVGYLPPVAPRPYKRFVTCSDDGGGKYELRRWRVYQPYVAQVIVRQVCGCVGKPCTYGQYNCCKMRNGGAPAIATYLIPVIFRNNYHADHWCPYGASKEYIACVNATYNLALPLDEKKRYDCAVLEPYVLKEGEPCVDYRYLRFVP